MEWINVFIGFVLHLDTHLYEVVVTHGTWVYGLLFLIIFAETGLVITPFLPGDSLLFAAGAVAAISNLDQHLLCLFLMIAAILGDAVNYGIGSYIGPRVFKRPKSLLFNPKNLHRAHHFYEKHGGKTIVIARFIPVIRTFAPFVAGIGQMPYLYFAAYNVIGGAAWVALFIYGGYFFGNLPLVERHFSIVIIAIIVVSLIPLAIEFARFRQPQENEST